MAFKFGGRSCFITESPKGNKLVYGSGYGVVLYDLEDPTKHEVVFGHKGDVLCARMSPNGYFCLSGDKTGFCRVWSVENKDHTSKLEFHASSLALRDCAWTEDNKRCVVVGNGKDSFGCAFMWDTGSRVGNITGHSGEILTCAMKPQRPFRLVTGGSDECVNFSKGPPFKFEHSNKGHDGFVNTVRYAPDGTMYATGSSDKSVAFFEGKDGKKIDSIKGAHKSSIYGLAFSPDGAKFLTASGDKSAKIWDTSSKKAENTFTYSGREIENIQLGALWGKSGPLTIALNGDISFLDEQNPKKPKRVIHGHNNRVLGLYCDDSNMFTCGYDGVVQWDLEKGAIAKVEGKQPKGGVQSVCCTKSELVVGGMDRSLWFLPFKKLTFKGVKKIQVPYLINEMASNGEFVFCVTARCILVYRASNKTEVCKFDLDYTGQSIDCFKNTVAVGGKDKKVHIYSFNKSKFTEKSVMDDHVGYINKCKFSKDGSLLATGSSDKDIIVWETDGYSIQYKNLVHHTGLITGLAWIDNGHLVSGSQDKNVCVWKLEEKKRDMMMVDQLGLVGVGFRDGMIITFGGEYSVKVWQYE